MFCPLWLFDLDKVFIICLILLVKKDEAADATLPARKTRPTGTVRPKTAGYTPFTHLLLQALPQRTNVKAFTPAPGFRCKTAAAISAPDPGTAAFPPRQKRVWCEFQLVFFCDTKYDTFMQALIIEHKAASIIANSQ